MHRDDSVDPPLLVCRVGSTTLTYLARAVSDLHAFLEERGEAWEPSPENPVGGWYGTKKGLRGRFGVRHLTPGRSRRPWIPSRSCRP